MILPYFLLNFNIFIESFIESDFIGILIYLSLFFLSVINWSVIIYTFFMLKKEERKNQFFENFLFTSTSGLFSPYFLEQEALAPCLYGLSFKAIERIRKKETLHSIAFSEVMETIKIETQPYIGHMERLSFLLPLVVTLSPFIGLLGTVWGILISFSGSGGSQGSSAILQGLSLALITTVIGLIIAIPALIAHAFLKNWMRRIQEKLQIFCWKVFDGEVIFSKEVDHG